MSDHPISTTYLDRQVARVSAVLPAAGAWDVAPIEMPCAGFDRVLFYFTYTRGGAGGDMRFRIEQAPDSAGAVWYQASDIGISVVASGADNVDNVQRAIIEYGSTGPGAELYMYGPFELQEAVERIRIVCCESGNVGAPGTVEIIAKFSAD